MKPMAHSPHLIFAPCDRSPRAARDECHSTTLQNRFQHCSGKSWDVRVTCCNRPRSRWVGAVIGQPGLGQADADHLVGTSTAALTYAATGANMPLAGSHRPLHTVT